MAEKTTSPAAPAGPSRTEAPSKMDAVRKALDALGPKARPPEIQAFVKERFGLEMTVGHAKTCKTKALGERGGKAKGKKKSAPAKAPARAAARPAAPAPAPAHAAGVGLSDIEAVKGLVGRVGAEQLRSLIDLLAR
jgi:hypothetical protein